MYSNLKAKDWGLWIVNLFMVGVPYFFMWVLTFPLGIIVALTAKPAKSPYGEEPGPHSQKYIDEGSSGFWEYWASPVKFVRWWNNHEDGLLGEPSGKHSARVKGKERSKWNIYMWTIRNPFNEGKRTSEYFACFVNDCIVTFSGTGDVSDGDIPVEGWYLCKAVHKKTGRTYYGYRKVKVWTRFKFLEKFGLGRKFNDWVDGKLMNAVLGFKIKPSHVEQVQETDDLDKAFTLRVGLFTDRG